MKFEEVLLHPYYDEIKKRCFADEPATEISNWVKNTVNSDPNIADDKKTDYYISDRKINAYKKLLQEQTKDIMVSIEKPTAVISTQPVVMNQVDIKYNEGAVLKPIVAKDVERNILKVNETFLNLTSTVEDLIQKLLKEEAQYGIRDTGMIRTIRSLLAELRQLLELYCKLTGREDFAKSLGSNLGEATAKTVLSKETKEKLMIFIRNILSDIDPESVPKLLAELEGILNG